METIQSEYYFSGYEDLEVHKLMIEDEQRMEAYKQAIFSNKTYFRDKIVMDVGCGTGILSIFCAQAGAKKIYAVEASNIAHLAREVVKENNYDNVIEVINSKVEDVILPEDVKVDTLISEWMGFYLLHEGMLDSVLAARDKFLKEDGQIFPESATIYIAPCSVPSLYKKWENIYGVSMVSFAKQLRASKYSKPEILNVNQEDMLAEEVPLCWINLKNDTVEDLNAFSVQHVTGAKQTGLYQGLCLWFECIFPNLSGEGDETEVKLDTSPRSLPTHWKQAVIVLPQEHEVEEGEPIAFQLDMTRDETNRRRYNLQVTLLDPETIEHPLPCSCDMTKCILIKTFMQQNAEKKFTQNSTNGGLSNILIEDDIDDEDDD